MNKPRQSKRHHRGLCSDRRGEMLWQESDKDDGSAHEYGPAAWLRITGEPLELGRNCVFQEDHGDAIFYMMNNRHIYVVADDGVQIWTLSKTTIQERREK